MKKTLLIILCFCAHQIVAQTYYRASNLNPLGFKLISDGAGGYYDALLRISGGYSRACLLHIDSSFNILWNMEIVVAGIIDPSDAVFSDNGDFVAVGKFLQDSVRFKGFMVRVDKFGDTLYTHQYAEDTADVFFKSIEEVSDGRLAIFGRKTNPDRTFVLITDANGIPLNEYNTLDSAAQRDASDGIITHDGGFLWGTSHGIIKTDSLLNIQWTCALPVKPFGIYDRFLMEDSNFNLQIVFPDTVPVGSSTSPGYRILKFDNAGNLLSSDSLNLDNYGSIRTINITSDNGMIMGCTYDFPGMGARRASWVIKLDSLNQIEWQYLYQASPGNVTEVGNAESIIEETDGYVIDGYHRTSQALVLHTIFKTDLNGNNCNLSDTTSAVVLPASFTVTPLAPVVAAGNIFIAPNEQFFLLTNNRVYTDYCNPLSGVLENSEKYYLHTLGNNVWQVGGENFCSDAAIRIMDVHGKIVYQNFVTLNQNISIDAFASGIYIYELKICGKLFTGKIPKF